LVDELDELFGNKEELDDKDLVNFFKQKRIKYNPGTLKKGKKLHKTDLLGTIDNDDLY